MLFSDSDGRVVRIGRCNKNVIACLLSCLTLSLCLAGTAIADEPNVVSADGTKTPGIIEEQRNQNATTSEDERGESLSEDKAADNQGASDTAENNASAASTEAPQKEEQSQNGALSDSVSALINTESLEEVASPSPDEMLVSLDTMSNAAAPEGAETALGPQASGNWEWEYNDDTGSANWINVNQLVSGNISSSNDVDYYKFTIRSNGYLSLTLSHALIVSGSLYWDVRLYREDGTEVHSMDVPGNRRETRCTQIGLPAGTYYVRVKDRYQFSNIKYNLRVNYVATNAWEKEFNDGFGTATRINTNSSLNGTLMTHNDEDYYVFSKGRSGGILSISLNHAMITNTSQYWTITLYEEDGTEYQSWRVPGNNAQFRTSRLNLPRGKYYVRVTDSYQYSDIKYNLRINYIA